VLVVLTKEVYVTNGERSKVILDTQAFQLISCRRRHWFKITV